MLIFFVVPADDTALPLFAGLGTVENITRNRMGRDTAGFHVPSSRVSCDGNVFLCRPFVFLATEKRSRSVLMGIFSIFSRELPSDRKEFLVLLDGITVNVTET